MQHSVFRLLVLLSAASIATGAAPGPWAAPGEIRDLGPGITPGVCVDSRGAVHVVYMRERDILYRTSDDGQTFGPEERLPVPEEAGNYNSPHLVAGPDDTIHLAFARNFTGESKKCWYMRRPDGRWTPPLLAIDQTAANRRANYPRLHVDGNTAYIGAFAGGGSIVARIRGERGTPELDRILETKLWAAHPLTRGNEILIVGRAGSRGHMLENYDEALEPTGPAVLLSHGTPAKTGEPTAAILDRTGTVHVAGVAGGAPEYLWYNNDRRAARGEPVLLGPVLGEHVKEYTIPTLCSDGRGTVFVSYRHHGTGEGMLTRLDPTAGKFASPTVFSTGITRRLRWNAPLAIAPDGVVHVVWETDGRIQFRSVRITAPAGSR